MRKNPTAKQLEQFQLVHDHAGNGLIMVEDIDSEYCRVFSTGAKVNPPFNQAFLAAKDRLKIEMVRHDPKDPESELVPRQIPEALLPALTEARRLVVNGEMRYLESWLVKTP